MLRPNRRPPSSNQNSQSKIKKCLLIWSARKSPPRPDTIVVKVGTRVLTRAGGALDEERIAAWPATVHALMTAGRKVAVVSSGRRRGGAWVGWAD